MKHGMTRLDKWIMDTADGNNSISNPARLQHEPTCDVVKCYEMPRKLYWDFRRIYDIQPVGYEELISIRGCGPASVRVMSLIGEIIFGTRPAWTDPVKYSFAHG